TSTLSCARACSRSAVAWMRVRPVPVRSCRNFGELALDTGHSLVPGPPAGTTAQNRSSSSLGLMAARYPRSLERVADTRSRRRLQALTREVEADDRSPHTIRPVVVEVEAAHLERGVEAGHIVEGSVQSGL